MSIFSNILNKIFHPHQAKANPIPAALPTPAIPLVLRPQEDEVDVSAILTSMAKNKSEKLNWKTSIVDLMKLLDLDSSLTARKELARELKFNGNTEDSATMNIWLHKQVMQKLAENGGKVPAELLRH